VLNVTTSRAGDLLGSGRARRPGPEAALIDDFVETFEPSFGDAYQCVVLREPRVESSGFPDLVMLVWDSATSCRWPSERRQIDRSDLRLAHLIYTLDGASQERLEPLVQNRLDVRLQRLQRAELIERSHGEWKIIPLLDAFAVREIVTFEAKMAFTSHVIDQAASNLWFASTSYVLLPTWTGESRLIDDADECGVGIWISGMSKPTLRHRPIEQPLSYASWLFNDWVWRASDSTNK